MAEKIKNVLWCSAPQVEAELSRLDAKWKPVEIPYGEIDWRTSATNKARFLGTVDSDVEKIVLAWLAGKTLPWIIVIKTATGYWVIDGLHRLTAFKVMVDRPLLTVLRNLRIPVYLVDTTDRKLIFEIQSSINQLNGHPLSPQEALAKAVILVKEHGRSQKEAAAAMSIHLSTLNRQLLLGEVEERLLKEKVPADRLPRDTVAALIPLRRDTAVMQRLAETALEYNVPASRIATAAKECGSKTSEAKRLETVAAFQQKVKAETTSGARTVLPKVSSSNHRPTAVYRRRILLYLGQLADFLLVGNKGKPFQTMEELQLTAEDKPVAQARVRNILYRCQVLGLTKGAKS